MIEMIARSLVLSLAWFAGINVVASVMSMVAAVAARKMSALDRPRLLVTIRLFPAAASLLFVGAMFVPSQWAFEPRDTDETFGLLWYALATVGGLLLARSILRAVSIINAARVFRLSEESSALGDDVREVHDLPGVSLAGIVRPQILINSRVVEDLTPAELDVVIAHETAHRDAFDNLTRWAFVCAPDLLCGSATAKRLEQEWCDAAEFRADARATRGDAARRLQLAAALIKVARLSAVWTGKSPAPFWSALHNSALLELRVRHLVNGQLPPPDPFPAPFLTVAITLLGTIVALPLVAETIHRVTEVLVAVLP
jgi:beta-lactamase regulating signal transducer with metallopeptidase domain